MVKSELAHTRSLSLVKSRIQRLYPGRKRLQIRNRLPCRCRRIPRKVENGPISERQIEPVELELGVTLKAPAVNGNAIQFGIMIGGITEVLLVVASLVVIRRQWIKA